MRAVRVLGMYPPLMARPKKQDTPADANGAPATPSAPNAAADAFTKTEPELAALAAEELAPPPADFGATINAVLAAAPRILAHRDAIAEQLPKHPIALVDKLSTYAQATWYAHLVHTYSSNGPEAAKTLVEEATKLRDGLLIAAEALAHRNLLDADAVAHIRKSNGDVAADLGALATLFKESWGKIASKTAVERHEIDRAAELGPAVLVATHTKNAGKPVDTEDLRTRAYTLLSAAYDAARHALAYVRWKEGDAESIAPSLNKKKAGRKPGAKKDEETSTEGTAAPEATETTEAS
ncbi:Hypothetical protein A7982_10074 [Minicystis rosea]|nr:Hypothetical protein A7982_10074 [Minicystis rosea]